MGKGLVWGGVAILAIAAGAFLVFRGWWTRAGDEPPDDGAGLSTKDLPETDGDFFHGIDGGVALTSDEQKGRNTWMLWTAGNQQMWDRLAGQSRGLVDLLKTIDSKGRSSRFKEMGLVNEPGFKGSNDGDPSRHGLRLDRADDSKRLAPDPRVYGESSGVLGLRLYKNPAFQGDAEKAWDAKRYYDDPAYYQDPKLVRPYMIGMACAFCHVAPHPLHPPADPEAPAYENLATIIGNQYLREGRALAVGMKADDFLKQMFDAQAPGTSDTSRLATDHINNPNMMNGIFSLGARLAIAEKNATENLAGGALDISGGTPKHVPHILKDGADSIGARGATIRVFVNIGMYSQRWLQRHDVLVGARPQQPFTIATAREHSTYWRATEERLDNILAFFKRIGPMKLRDAPGGGAHLKADEATLKVGRQAFAAECARCHSSKRPPDEAPGDDLDRPEKLAAWFSSEVEKPDFLDENFLSTDRRYPVSRIGTNAARALGTNAVEGHVWDNFSSQSYKRLPSVGTIVGQIPWGLAHEAPAGPADPFDSFPFVAPAGGPGYYRPTSLIAVWSSAPLLHNNALGTFSGDPSVAGRVADFEDAAKKLLWPETRDGVKSVWRTTTESYVTLPVDLLPEPFPAAVRHLANADGAIRIGPIPKGTPINLLASFDPEFFKRSDFRWSDVRELGAKLKDLKEMAAAVATIVRNDRKGGSAAETTSGTTSGTTAAWETVRRDLVPFLLKASKCPDFVEDRGHDYGSGLSDDQKRALIEYMKTF